jgi:glycosyltransferase involved in cell wall biosynthesis
VIPNGIPPPSSNRSLHELRALVEIPNDPQIRVVGQVSRLTPFKGHMQLLEAARLVLNERSDVYFLIVGFVRDVAYRRLLLERAAELRIADRVRMISYAGNIGDMWKLIDIYAHASLFDSLPNAIIESMSLAKPSVVTAVGGVPSLVQNGRTGLVVAPNDPGALGKALLCVLENAEFAKRLGDAAYLRYLEGYTPERMTTQLEQLFLDLVSRRRFRRRL